MVRRQFEWQAKQNSLIAMDLNQHHALLQHLRNHDNILSSQLDSHVVNIFTSHFQPTINSVAQLQEQVNLMVDQIQALRNSLSTILVEGESHSRTPPVVETVPQGDGSCPSACPCVWLETLYQQLLKDMASLKLKSCAQTKVIKLIQPLLEAITALQLRVNDIESNHASFVQDTFPQVTAGFTN